LILIVCFPYSNVAHISVILLCLLQAHYPGRMETSGGWCGNSRCLWLLWQRGKRIFFYLFSVVVVNI